MSLASYQNSAENTNELIAKAHSLLYPFLSIPLQNIIYIYAIPNWKVYESTPFQGFAPGLLPLMQLFTMLPHLPADITELTLSPIDRLARQRAGLGGWMWSPMNIDSLIKDGAPTPRQPFMVVFTADEDVANRVCYWSNGIPIKPLHVSLIPNKEVIRPSELTVEHLQSHCAMTIQKAQEHDQQLDINNELLLIKQWQTFTKEPSSLRFHSHNVTMPNEMVLTSAGQAAPSDKKGHLDTSPRQDYIDGITESAQAVLAVQAKTDEHGVYLIHPARPDIILFAPTTFRGILQEMQRNKLPPGVMRALKTLERQQDYRVELNLLDLKPLFNDVQDFLSFLALLSVRGEELKLQTLALGLRATSTLAATIRMPPSINRTEGLISQFTRHIRSYDDIPPDTKTARVFKAVQAALLEHIPKQHIDLLSKSRFGVKIVGNVPLEWLPINGLPLGIWTDVSRINVTPGNMLINQLGSVLPVLIPVESFREYLMVSMFEDSDNLAYHIPKALRVLSKNQELKGTIVKPKSKSEFVTAINAYKGPLLIIDSHGEHPESSNVGGLILNGKPIEVWELGGELNVPPIVILSACDSHPFDRSHATVANGFLHCGAVSVLSTVLPIRGHDAAVFLARLMLRTVQYAGYMTNRGQSVQWTNIVGGALRMQLVSDVMTGMIRRKMLSQEQAIKLQLQANLDINQPRADWLERLGQQCCEHSGLDVARWQTTFDDIVAGSDVIRYVNLGNPESIILFSEAAIRAILTKTVE